MSLSFSNPRGDLPPPNILPTSYVSRLLHSDRNRHSRSSIPFPAATANTPKPRNTRHPCYDWIFSSASSVHVAVDRSAFTTYTPFKSYVLAVSDHRQIPVKGIGSVDLDLRRKKGSRQCHTITLENVLHIPGWMCNIFSDIYFEGFNGGFEHTWSSEGVQFMKKKDGDKLRTWGFTEEFRGLDKLVLARNGKGRSPMLEDPEREVFSINLNWPQHQRDRWQEFAEKLEDGIEDEEAGMLKEKDRNLMRRSQSALCLKA
jgi:hypothetical protein